MLTIDEAGDPAENHPNDWTEYDSSEIRCLIHVVCIRGFIQENTCNDLGALMSENKEGMKTLTWCMAKNSAKPSNRPVYHGKIDMVLNIKKKKNAGNRKIASFVLR